MSGTAIGGKKASITNKQRYGDNFYSVIGQRGGRNGHGGGFASEVIGIDGLSGRERASVVGAIGGKKSRRTAVRNQDSQAQKDINALQELK